MAKDKGKAAKHAAKKEPYNWAKIAIPLLMVFLMIGSIFAYVASNNSSKSGSSTSSINRQMNSISDALTMLPANASFVRFADLKGDTKVNASMYSSYWNTLPPAKYFNANPQKDTVAVYPIGYFGNNTQNVVSLTDFGTQKLNTTYTAYSIYEQSVLEVNKYYYFTPKVKPVISGGAENVAYTLQVFLGNNSTAYKTYADLFDELKAKQISISGMTLETAGKDVYLPLQNVSSLSYYAGIGPMPANATVNLTAGDYRYVAIVRLNQTPTDQEWQEIALISNSKKLTGFHKYDAQIYDNYMVIEAQGPESVCLDDMATWGYMKYKYTGSSASK